MSVKRALSNANEKSNKKPFILGKGASGDRTPWALLYTAPDIHGPSENRGSIWIQNDKLTGWKAELQDLFTWNIRCRQCTSWMSISFMFDMVLQYIRYMICTLAVRQSERDRGRESESKEKNWNSYKMNMAERTEQFEKRISCCTFI